MDVFMVSISNLVKNDDFISFHLIIIVKITMMKKDFFSFDLLEEKIIESKLAPMEEKTGYEMYQTVAIGYAIIM